jgi:hypothetical protein
LTVNKGEYMKKEFEVGESVKIDTGETSPLIYKAGDVFRYKPTDLEQELREVSNDGYVYGRIGGNVGNSYIVYQEGNDIATLLSHKKALDTERVSHLKSL